MSRPDCGHETDGPLRRTCCHLLDHGELDFYWRFTGQGVAYDLICVHCQKNLDGVEANLRTTCLECFEAMRNRGDRSGFVGQPGIVERESSLSFRHSTVRLSGSLEGRILDIQPVPSLDRNLWIAITQAGQLYRLDLDDQSFVPLCRLSGSNVDLAADVSLTLSTNGRMAAVVNTRGRHGVVVDLDSGKQTMPLDRGDYHEEHCNFPVAFFENQGRLLLVHGTDWNRLEISDPATGTRFTERSPTSYQQGQERPEHYLDYFHCGLTVSPNQQYIADNGWVWHPVGVVATWSLTRWLHENVWESEDGKSKKDLCGRDFWDGPLCWVGDKRLAVWGLGDEDGAMIAAVRIFNVESGEEERWFPGPKENLIFDRYLFSLDKEEGTSVWDVDTGERLLRESSFCPLRYHRGTKSFLTIMPDGGFLISQLAGRTVKPDWLTWNGGTVVCLAQAIRVERAFERLPILADALEDAGCSDADLLQHCRQPGQHARSCWVVDIVLENDVSMRGKCTNRAKATPEQ